MDDCCLAEPARQQWKSFHVLSQKAIAFRCLPLQLQGDARVKLSWVDDGALGNCLPMVAKRRYRKMHAGGLYGHLGSLSLCQAGRIALLNACGW